MRPNTAPQGVPDGPVRVEFEVQFSRGPKGRRRARECPRTDEVSVASPTLDGAAMSSMSGTKPAAQPSPLNPSQVPRITHLLVLGHHFERLVRDGVVKDYAEIAKLTGLSRARITQIVNLALLAPEIQEGILFLRGAGNEGGSTRESSFRQFELVGVWAIQRRPCLRLHCLPALA